MVDNASPGDNHYTAKFCPLLKQAGCLGVGECMLYDCAWWEPIQEKCIVQSLPALAYQVEKLQEQAENLASIMWQNSKV